MTLLRRLTMNRSRRCIMQRFGEEKVALLQAADIPKTTQSLKLWAYQLQVKWSWKVPEGAQRSAKVVMGGGEVSCKEGEMPNWDSEGLVVGFMGRGKGWRYCIFSLVAWKSLGKVIQKQIMRKGN